MTPRTLGLVFAIATALFWGTYGPALLKARTPGETPFKPFIFIGLAYLLWGAIGGIVAVKVGGGTFSFRPEAVRWGFIAGSLGAFGALTLTFAMFQAKDARLVMPIVFGGATAVAVLIGVLSQEHPHVDFRAILGYLFVIAGVVLIQMYGAHGPPPKKAAPESAEATASATVTPADEASPSS